MEKLNQLRQQFNNSMWLSVGLGVTLLFSLFYFAGTWEILTFTRALNLLIEAGIVQYDDMGAGIIEGLPDLEWYMLAQEYVSWPVVSFVIFLFSGIWLIKSYQFHIIAKYYGLDGSYRTHLKSFTIGTLSFFRFTPLGLGEKAAAADLIKRGATPYQGQSVAFLSRVLAVFEVVFFAVIGLLVVGWADWAIQLLWAGIVFIVLYWWVKPAQPSPGETNFFNLAYQELKLLQLKPGIFWTLIITSIVSFSLIDASAYFLSTAFSSANVILHLDYGILLMAIIAGYLSRQIPLTPAGIGQFEWAFTASLFLTGVGFPEAATVAILFSFFYYGTLLILYLVSMFWRETNLTVNEVLEINEQPATGIIKLPKLQFPIPQLLWKRILRFSWVVLIIFLFDQTADLFTNFWMLESLDFNQVFWTNFNMGIKLFIIGFLLFFAMSFIPVITNGLKKEQYKFGLSLSLILGLLGGYSFSLNYHDILYWFNGVPFEETDSVFNKDLGFYIYQLPGVWKVWDFLVTVSIFGLISSLIYGYLSRKNVNSDQHPSGFFSWLKASINTLTVVNFTFLFVLTTVGFWLSRYQILTKDSYDASIFSGASYLDVKGLFSTLNNIHFSTLISFLIGILLTLVLISWKNEKSKILNKYSVRQIITLCGMLILLDFGFAIIVGLRGKISVTPDQPNIQLPFIQEHINATRKAYGLEDIEEITFSPRKDQDELPNLDKLLATGGVSNAPLWPTYVDYMEKVIDPDYGQRIIQTQGDKTIYGPTLDMFQQKQKLRAYYRFLNMDVLRFTRNIDNEQKKLILSASVREAPILEPVPWLTWWGQRFMLFTHGHGLVTAPHGQKTDSGEPIFYSSGIPTKTIIPELELTNPRVYYGEGSAIMAFSNVKDLGELDYPTEQGRAEINLPEDYPAGIPVDNLLKRIILGWQSGEFFELVFSDIITKETRAHFYRQPLERLNQIIPFLFVEDNPYPVPVNGEIHWMVNGIATSDQYPYSTHEYLGDKAISRASKPIDTRKVNYLEDAIKATVNAANGKVRIFKISDKPIVNTWSKIYPGLFEEKNQMPQEVAQQMVYPIYLFHALFDDLYIYYHMEDATYFFNMEDMWDDADDVRGPILDVAGAITWSFEPFHVLINTDTFYPKSDYREQFTMAMPFSPEGAKNLRAIPMVYQDGKDYGKTFVLQVPKGEYTIGPEQADAIIDQDPYISEKFSWWDRRGAEVIRGHTSLMFYENEVIYIEPIFIRSQQNSMPQMQKVIVVVRGHAFMGNTIQESLKMAYESEELSKIPRE